MEEVFYAMNHLFFSFLFASFPFLFFSMGTDNPYDGGLVQETL